MESWEIEFAVFAKYCIGNMDLNDPLQEQEARTEKLRIKARNKSLGSASYGYEEEEIGPQPMPDVAPTGVSPSQPLPRTHINFFSEIEAGVRWYPLDFDWCYSLCSGFYL